ncbi:hypothetical protein BGZ76_000515 [Entomortierella beljakovae]|nr:hypothetical protein BGZ76_000515 [Entomortierella beljakovae]
MLAMPNPQRDFIELLFERLLFEETLSQSDSTSCCIDPTKISMIFHFIHTYYSELGLKEAHSYRENGIVNQSLHTPQGVRIFLSNFRDRFKLIPASFTATFDFGNEAEANPFDHVGCKPITGKQVKDFNKSFASIIEKDYRNEIDLLVDIVKANGLIEKKEHATRPSNTDEHIKAESKERYLSRLEKATQAERRKIEQTLVEDIKTLTSMEVIVLSSFARGINISDHDLELLLVEPSLEPSSSTIAKTEESSQSNDTCPKRVVTMPELINSLKLAGHRSVQIVSQYSDTSCDINASYARFYDKRSGRSCQITLENPLAVPLRDLIQAYASIDDRLEKLVYGLQQVTLEYGRCEMFLGNYAITLMAIAFMQKKKLLPKLQYREGTGPMGDQSRPHNQQYKPITSNMTVNQRKANARQNRRLRGLGITGGRTSADNVTEIVQVPTQTGTPRGVDCHFQKYKPGDQPSIKRGTATADDLIPGFLHFFLHESDFITGDQISIVDCPNTPNRANFPEPMNRSAQRHNMNQRQSNTRGNPHSRSRFGQVHRLVGLHVIDPFVVERNVTNSCTGWRLEATLVCFQKALNALSAREISSGHIFDVLAACANMNDDSDDCDNGEIEVSEDVVRAMAFLSFISERD